MDSEGQLNGLHVQGACCCPECRAAVVQADPETVECAACGKNWPVVRGVPNFLDEPLTPEDPARAEWLVENYDRLSYDEMLRTMTEELASRLGDKDDTVRGSGMAVLALTAGAAVL